MGARVPADVPLHRPSVGADPTNMGNRQPDNFYENFKPYVYRGCGIDTLTAHLGEDLVRDEILRRAAEAREARKARPKPKPKARKPKARKPYKPRLYPYYGPEHVLEPPTEPEPEPERFRLGDPRHPDHAKYYRSKPRRYPVRPAEGWQPTTGDDIDALLDELSD